MIEVGKWNHLEVVRKTDLGYMLSDGHEEILLHYKETNRELELSEHIDAYVYTDKKNRKTGTMSIPMLVMDKPDFVRVVGQIDEVGILVDNHTPKDILVSKDYLPYDISLWPKQDDVLFCGLKIKKDTLVAKPLNRFDLHYLYTGKIYEENEKVNAYVMSITQKGLGLITTERVYVFVPNAQFRNSYRLGQEVTVTITKMLVKEAYGMLNERKEVLMDKDKTTIIDYLKTHDGTMPLTAKSSSEDVEKLFQMSRKAFKRAYGALYKEHMIEFDETNTKLKKL